MPNDMRKISFSPILFIALNILGLSSSQAQTVQNAVKPASATLKMSPLLQEAIPQTVQQAPITFIYGDRISGRPDIETKVGVATGKCGGYNVVYVAQVFADAR